MKFQDYLTYQFKDEDIIHFTDFFLLSNHYFYGMKQPHEWWKSKKNQNKNINKITNSIKNENAILYCYAKETSLLHCFDICAKDPKSKYVIILTRTDHSVSSDITHSIPKNAILLCHNLTSVHYRSHALPYGVKFDRGTANWIGNFQHPQKYDFNQRKLLYCNFSLKKHKGYQQRNKIYKRLKKHDWITFAHMGAFMQYDLSQSEYHNDLLNHKFTLSPRGNGIDCYRTWEALYLKSIPIVENNKYWQHFRGLPILVVDSYDYITSSFLEEAYANICEKEFEIDILKLSYWRRLIKEKLK